MLGDVRCALRFLARNRSFATTAVLALAIGIGVNTAVFSVVHAVLLTPLPYHDPSRIVRLHDSMPSRGLTYFSVSPANYLDWKAQAQSFERIAPFDRQRSMTLTNGSDPASVLVARVSHEIFALLGVSPARGRALAQDDEQGSPHDVAVVSDEFWRTHLGSNPAALGRSLILDNRPHVVVGVMPPDFSIPGSPANVWVPLVFQPGELHRSNHILRVLARLKPGVTVDQARAELTTIAARLAAQYPDTNRDWTVAVRTLSDVMIGSDFERALKILTGAVVFVLLIACANVANLLLAMAAGRTREIAVRLALGASRRRLVRQALTESAILAAVAGALGFLLALWAVDGLKALAPAMLPRIDAVRVNETVLAFSLGVSIVAGLLFGTLPAFQLTSARATSGLRDAIAAATLTRQRMRRLLVVGELALALVLLAGAGLLIRSFIELQRVDLGFNPDRVVAIDLALPRTRDNGPQAVRAFYDQLIERLAATSGVRVAAATSSAPLAGLNSALTLVRDGAEREADLRVAKDADYRITTPGYFAALGISVVAGRTYTRQDGPDSPLVCVISRTAADAYWPKGDAIGRTIRPGPTAPEITILGIVGDVRHFGADSELRPMLYFPLAQSNSPAMTVVARVDGASEPVIAGARAIVRSIDRQLPLGRVTTMADIVAAATSERRFNVLLLELFAASALTLAIIGVYGVVSYAVNARQREIGVRIALGARPRDVMRMVVGQGLSMVLIGLGVGVIGALWLTRAMAGLLFQVQPNDAFTYASAGALLVAIGLAASYLPARRAMKLDPVTALRNE